MVDTEYRLLDALDAQVLELLGDERFGSLCTIRMARLAAFEADLSSVRWYMAEEERVHHLEGYARKDGVLNNQAYVFRIILRRDGF